MQLDPVTARSPPRGQGHRSEPGEYRVPLRMNQTLRHGGDPGGFIPGSVKDNRLLAADVTLPVPELTVHRATLTAPSEARPLSVGHRRHEPRHSHEHAAIVSTITCSMPCIGSRLQMRSTSSLPEKEGVLAFPLRCHSLRSGTRARPAWGEPVTDMLPGATGNGSPRGRRRAKGRVGAARGRHPTRRSSRSATSPGPLPASLDLRDATLFSYVMNNYGTRTPRRAGWPFHVPLPP